MQKNTSFSLGPHFSGFIEEQVAACRCGNASDVLRAALIEGEECGFEPFDMDKFLAEMKASAQAAE